MGLLTIGKALDATATTIISGYIRDHGITQFLSTYARVKGDALIFVIQFLFLITPDSRYYWR